jgi:hypothetical protein
MIDENGKPSAAVRESLLWKLHHYRLSDENIILKHFEEVYTSKNRMIRIYKVAFIREFNYVFSVRFLIFYFILTRSWKLRHGIVMVATHHIYQLTKERHSIKRTPAVTKKNYHE